MEYKNDRTDVKYHLDRNHVQSPIDYGGIRLHQIGRMFCSPGTVVAQHTHLNWFELTIATQGEGEIITNNVPVKIKQGDIYLSLPCDRHMIRSSMSNPLKFDFFSFGTDLEPFKEALDKIAGAFYQANQRVFSDIRLNEIIEELNAEFSSPEVMPENLLSGQFIASSLRLAVIHVIRAFLKLPREKVKLKPLSASEELCYQIMNYIDTHIYSIKNLSELTEVTGYNYSYISFLFKKTTSQTLSEYFTKKRMETAKILLTEENMTAVRVSELLGYSSACAFSKAFCAYFAISPGKMKKNKKTAF